MAFSRLAAGPAAGSPHRPRRRGRSRLALPVLLLLLGCLGPPASPAGAELAVRVAPRTAELYQSVRVVVEDPTPAGSSSPTPAGMTLTIADPRDRRLTVRLPRVGAARWEGRFIALATGRHTGTAVLQRGEDREIGLVPAVTVKPGRRRGFPRALAPGGRMFECQAGGLFPMGTVIENASQSSVDWAVEFARLRRQGANYARMTVPWSAADALGTDGDEGEPTVLGAMVDRWLSAAEREGLFLQLRLAGPEPSPAIAAAPEAYQRWLEAAARRWGGCSSLAAWEVDGSATGDATGVATLVAALRNADPYRHLITVDAARPTVRVPGVDFVTCYRALSHPDAAAPAAIWLGGGGAGASDLWEGLTQAGLGLPLQPHVPGADPAQTLPGLPVAAGLAARVPWHSRARLQVAAGGSEDLEWRSYGSTLLASLPAAGAAAALAAAPVAPLDVSGAAPHSLLRVYRADGQLVEERALAASGGSITLRLTPLPDQPLVACVLPRPTPSGSTAAASRRR
jgi:hypothetical protein